MKPTSVLTIALVLLAAAVARAQDTTLGDARWAPWLGCWHLLQDDRGSLAAAATNPDDVVVCVLPASGNRGVSITTYVGGQSVLQQAVVADGARHPVSEPECSGSQTSEWSLSGQRLFTRADITCIGQPARTVSAITLMAAGPTWVDIQAVGTDQDAQVRVRRYRRTDSLPQSVVLPADLQGRPVAVSARLAGPTVMTLEEVVEASRKVAAPAVAAALYETGSRFDLNGRTLKALAGGGVPDGVVDVMVALSFPGHVAIDRPFRGSTGQTRGAYYPPSVYDPCYAYRPYPPYYFYYSPFGYSSWWGDPYRPYYSPGRRPVIIRPGGSARPGGGDRDRGHVVQGRGYTRGGSAASDAPRPRREAAADDETRSTSGATSGTSSRRAVSRGGYTSGRPRSGGGSSAGARSRRGGSTSPSGSGSTSGGSGARSGRTAQPR